jgi:hypothetical protein
VPPGVVSLVTRGAPGTPTGAGASGGLRTPGGATPSHSASAAAATAMLSAMTTSSRPGTAASTPAAGAGAGGANSFSGGVSSSRPTTAAAYHSASGEAAPSGGQQATADGSSRGTSSLRPHLAIDLATANSMSGPSDMPQSPGSGGRPPLVTSRARSNHLPSNLGDLGLGEQAVLLDSGTAHLRQIAALRQEVEDQRGLIARLRRQLDESDSRWGWRAGWWWWWREGRATDWVACGCAASCPCPGEQDRGGGMEGALSCIWVHNRWIRTWPGEGRGTGVSGLTG